MRIYFVLFILLLFFITIYILISLSFKLYCKLKNKLVNLEGNIKKEKEKRKLIELKKIYIYQSIILFMVFFILTISLLYFNLIYKKISLLFNIKLLANIDNIILIVQNILFFIILFFLFKNFILKEDKNILRNLNLKLTFQKNNLIYGLGFIIILLIIPTTILLYYHSEGTDFIVLNLPENFLLYLIINFYYSFFEEYFFRYYLIYKQEKYFMLKEKYRLENYELKNISFYFSINVLIHIKYLYFNPFYIIVLVLLYQFLYWYKSKTKSIIYPFLFHLLFNIATYIIVIKFWEYYLKIED